MQQALEFCTLTVHTTGIPPSPAAHPPPPHQLTHILSTKRQLANLNKKISHKFPTCAAGGSSAQLRAPLMSLFQPGSVSYTT